MSNRLFCVLFSLLITNVFSYSIDKNIISSDVKCDYKDLIDVAEKILTLCRPEESELTLLLGGDCDEFLRHAFFGNIPVALVAETGSYRYNALEKFALTRYSYNMHENYNFVHFLQKLHRFVLVASSKPILQSLLQKIKDSPWANSDGFFILIDRQTKHRGCINARSFLWTAWEYDLLSVIFICIEQNEIFYYTYNPYSNSTPTGWDEVERVKGREGHPLIILKKKFTNDQNVCKNMEFDKTSNLKGYKIRLNAVEMIPFITVNLSAHKNTDKFHGDNSEVIKILIDKLKAVLKVKIYNKHYDLGSIGPNGTLRGLLASVSDGKVDIGMNTRALFILWKVKYTYPHTRSGLCVITQPIPEISQFTKLITFMSSEVIAGMIIICLLIYLIFAKNEGYIKAGLQVIRLVVCVGVSRPPKVNSTRIFLCMALILFLIVNALFQSHLSSLLTVPVFKRIDSLERIKEAGYTLYGSSSMKDFINDPVLKSRYVEVPYNVCKQHAENSSTAACFGDCYHLYTIKGKNLVKSKMLIEILHSYVTREDWPLYNQVDHIFQQMNEAGLFQKSRVDSLLEIIHKKKRREAMRKGFKVMLLEQLAFSFYILIIGYTCAIIVFILELVIDRSSKPKNWKNIVKNKKENKEVIINNEISLQY